MPVALFSVKTMPSYIVHVCLERRSKIAPLPRHTGLEQLGKVLLAPLMPGTVGQARVDSLTLCYNGTED